jgi:cobalt-zinc-cadmium efflux system outer membrane protein
VTATEIPAGIRLDDGLTPDESVAVALWNNAAFQVSASELGFARADLLEAGVLTNPVLSLLFPLGPKQLETTLRWPVEVLWERPRRVAAAELAADAAAQRLVQAGLDLVLAVRMAYADLSLAADRERIATETAALLIRIDTLTQSRLAAGDIGTLDARAARVDGARAQEDADRGAYDVAIARDRLRLLLGLTADANPFELAPPAAPAAACGPTADLLREALVARPDVRAAELGVEAAAARLGWEKSRILTLTAVLDANGQGRQGFEAGPGLDASLPIFNRNQGGRARANAELQRASAAYGAIQQQVALELRESSAQFDQARQSVAAWRDRIVTPLQANLTDAEQSFAEGDTSYLFVLENSRRLTEARVRERELTADEQRARARIERAVGRSCSAPRQEATRDH